MSEFTRQAFKKQVLTDKQTYHLLQDFACQKPNAPMLVSEKASFSSTEVCDYTGALAVFLHDAGVKNGAVVALSVPRCIDTILIIYALLTAGAVAVLCDPHTGVKEHIEKSGVDLSPDFYISNESGAWTLYDKRFCAMCEVRPWQTRVHSAEKIKEITDKADIHAPACILFTSGTTDKSKAVVHSQYALINGAFLDAARVRYCAQQCGRGHHRRRIRVFYRV